jgi:hypothetical protein
LLTACGTSLPGPAKTPQPQSAFVEVPAPPPPAQLERVPARPRAPSVWVDGTWEWTGSTWRWRDGGWFEKPADGIFYAEPTLSRPQGPRLLFAGASWRTRAGALAAEPKLLVSAALGSPDADGGAP